MAGDLVSADEFLRAPATKVPAKAVAPQTSAGMASADEFLGPQSASSPTQTPPPAASPASKPAGRGWLRTALNAAESVGSHILGLPFKPSSINAPQMASLTRGVLTSPGWVGDLEKSVSQTIPSWFGVAPSRGGPWGEGTILPTSENFSRGLSKVGFKPIPGQQTAEEVGNFIGSAALPVGMLQKGASAVASKLNRFRAEGGKATQAIEALSGDISKEAQSASQRVIASAPKVPENAVVPAPDRAAILKDLPGVESGQPASQMAVSKEFEDAATSVENALQAQKQRVASTFFETHGDKVVHPDLHPLTGQLIKEMDQAPGGPLFSEQQALLNSLRKYEESPQATLKGYDQLRRALSEKAAYGQEDKSGFATLKQLGFGDKYAKALAKALDDVSPEYKNYRAAYSKLGARTEPFTTRFLKSLGSNEGTASTLMGKAMAHPENVDRAIEALGGDTRKFDAMAAKYVVGELSGKSSAQIEKYMAENAPVLKKLAATRRVAGTMLQRSDMADAMKRIADQAEKRLGEGAKARNEALSIAERYRTPLQKLQVDSPKRTPATLHEIVNQMHKDNLVTDAQYRELRARINAAQSGIDKEEKLKFASKYVVYALTHSYMISFGGPAFFEYITHK